MLTQSKPEVLSVLLIVTVKAAQCVDGPVGRIDWIINAEQLLKQNTRKRSNDVAGQRKALQEHTHSLLPPKAHAHCYHSVTFLSSFLVAASASAFCHI